ncbi:hypothetical protein ATANTOWER_026475 [Ataeniobius toweri]|uniref:Uncharacterized protein n=1 Tax=Ataeniobius toweri TaxID=208326 RepID=A0ABU7BEP8_9TELE|nr:hypothetical protein [Ataeniobius toweri]
MLLPGGVDACTHTGTASSVYPIAQQPRGAATSTRKQWSCRSCHHSAVQGSSHYSTVTHSFHPHSCPPLLLSSLTSPSYIFLPSPPGSNPSLTPLTPFYHFYPASVLPPSSTSAVQCTETHKRPEAELKSEKEGVGGSRSREDESRGKERKNSMKYCELRGENEVRVERDVDQTDFESL